MVTIYFVEFSEWLEAEFIKWRGGSRAGVTDFARHLGVKQQQLSDWLLGKYKPRGENVARLAEKLGPEVYEALGLARPASDTQDARPPGFFEWMNLFLSADEQTRQELLERARSEARQGREKRTRNS